jgi:hypothetical protein
MDSGGRKQGRFKIDCFSLAKFRQLAKIILKMATSTSFFGFLVPKLPSLSIYIEKNHQISLLGSSM